MDGKVLKGDGGVHYISSKKLAKIRRHSLLHFLRLSEHTVHDIPKFGDDVRSVDYSKIIGPQETKFEFTLDGSQPEFGEQRVKLLVPKRSMPVDFEDVSLVRYGTELDESIRFYIQLDSGTLINSDGLLEISREIIAELGLNISEEQNQYSDRTMYNDCLVEFMVVDVHPYPIVNFVAFGERGKPEQLVEKLGLLRLTGCFEDSVSKVAAVNVTREGYGYNLGNLENLTLPDKGIPQKLYSGNFVF